MNTKINKQIEAFTLIELLVVISIVGILLGLSVFGMQGARQASRDAKRKADLEQIRSGIEMYKADCGTYPTSLTFGGSLSGNCPTNNIYISSVPVDPVSISRSYLYYSDGITYQICASLEQGGASVSCGTASNCGGATCNYKATNP